MAAEQRTTEQGHVIDAELLRRFLRAALEHDAVADTVNDLLYEHIVERRYHASVVAASLPNMISDVLEAATTRDWQIITQELVSNAREAIGEPSPARRPNRKRSS